jgi:hypothetical protein
MTTLAQRIEEALHDLDAKPADGDIVVVRGPVTA